MSLHLSLKLSYFGKHSFSLSYSVSVYHELETLMAQRNLATIHESNVLFIILTFNQVRCDFKFYFFKEKKDGYDFA